MPWFFNDDYGGGWIEKMRREPLERLHDELHRQGEEHTDQPRVDSLPVVDECELVKPLPAGSKRKCRRSWCRALAARTDGLCRAHGAED